MKKISIIIPTFNEEKNIGQTLDQLFQLINKIKLIKYEIIVVDDGSTDKTLEILKKYPIKIIKHSRNMGYGASLKHGINKSAFNNIAIMDADGTYPPRELYRLLNHIGANPLLIGARSNYFSIIRHTANKTLAFLASILFQTWISDLNSGMRIFNRDLIEKFDYNTWPDGFSFTTRMTLFSIINNIPIKEISIRCETRKGSSKANIAQLGMNIVKLFFYFLKLKYRKTK